jgi:hypothetical protein
VNGSIEKQEPPDPWKGRQPRYEKLVMAGPDQFHLVTRLPSGEPINVPLAPMTFSRRDDDGLWPADGEG